MDDHEVGKLPGVGFKLAQKIRSAVLQRPAEFDTGLVYGGTKEHVLVKDVLAYQDMSSEFLEKLLGGPGAPQGIGTRIWSLLHGSDKSEVGQGRDVPRQISIEDSYLQLNTLEEVNKELRMLATSLVNRLRIDLLEDDEGNEDPKLEGMTEPRRWLAHPKVLRLSTRPRGARNPDGGRSRSFQRISRSTSVPNFVFNLTESAEVIAEKLVTVALVPLFRKLHPEKNGWDLSLINLAMTNMDEVAGEGKTAKGRDISKMFKQQDDMLKDWRVKDESVPPDNIDPTPPLSPSLEALPQYESLETLEVHEVNDEWEVEQDEADQTPSYTRCDICGAMMPAFAMTAHNRFHRMGE
jgi:DNA polymerase iota